MLVLPLVVSVLALARTPQDAAPTPPPADPALAAIDTALERGAGWLRAREREDGSFEAVGSESVCPVALSAMALWSLCESQPRALDDEHLRAAVRYLVGNQREDGGIYDPSRGLAVYTTGVAVRALRAAGDRAGDPEVGRLVANAELFVYRRAAPESIIDAAAQGHVPVAKSAETAREMLDQPGASLDADKRKALEFLANAKRDSVRAPSRVRASGQRATQSGIGPFTYDDLLPFVYLDLSPDHTIALRALEALRTYYALDHNPDLTKRYGPGGFQPGTQGLFYYYLVVARALSTYGVKTIQTADGAKHEWAREISSKLLELQRPDGSWVNQDARWWEHEPALVTSYALLTLSRCRASLAAPDPAKR